MLSRSQRRVFEVVQVSLAAFLLLNLLTAFNPTQAGISTAPSVAEAATGSLVPGNPTCAEVAVNAASAFKVEPVSGGSHSDGTLTVNITLVDTADGPTLNWTSNMPVSLVIVKGGPNANVYTYSGGSTSDSGLHAPKNPSGSWAGLSHVDFCYSAPATRTPTTTPTRTATTAPATATSTSTTAPTQTATRTRTPTETLGTGTTPAATATLGSTAVATATSPGGPSTTGNIAIFKVMCDQIGQQDTCNGRDTSLSDYHIDFNVFVGPLPTGNPIQTSTVTLSDNAQGVGNVGNGSQGRTVGGNLPVATYTVCEVQRAYRAGFPDVSLVAVPRPTAGNGGSTGGSNQDQLPAPNEMCIKVDLTPGTAELKFLDQRAQALTPTVGATVTGTPPTATPTVTGTPPTATPTGTTPAESLTPTRTNTPRATSTVTNTPLITSTRTSTPTEVPETATATPSSTNTRVPTSTRTNTPLPTPTQNPQCVPNARVDLSGIITGVVNGMATGVVTNTSTLCSYPAGIASYSINGNTQTFFSGNTTTIAPGATVTLTVPVPACLFEVDLFIGNTIVTTGANGNARYGSNLLDLMTGGSGTCVPTVTPTQTATLTSGPTATLPLPTLTLPPLTATLPPTATNTAIPPSPTITNTPFPTPTQPPACQPNANRDMRGVITGVINGVATGVVVNNNTLCTYVAGIASYSINGNSQTLFASNTTIVPPGATVTLTVPVPPCLFEVDLFIGNNVVNGGANGNARYGNNLLDLLTGTSGNCSATPTPTATAVPPTATNTAVPGASPTPTNTAVPNASPTPTNTLSVPNASATPTNTAIPGATATPTNTEVPGATATPTSTETLPTVGPQLTATPVPTETPGGPPTVTPTPTFTGGHTGPIIIVPPAPLPPTNTPFIPLPPGPPGGFPPQQPQLPPPPQIGRFPGFRAPQIPAVQAPNFGQPVLAGSVPVLSGVLPSIFPPAPAPAVAGVQAIAGLPPAPVQSGVAGIIDVPEQPALPGEVQGVSEQIRPAQLPNTGIATGGLDVLTLIAGIMMVVGLVLAKIASRVRRRV